ncbi:GNAT family N-acetyltransferase [Gordonia soli]|uniref:Putative acetyltransferase n=1 Tax=Gordonia soli NBRC 108243 TaxID=1223545 RepID=M0QJ70_9ACTN|nr:GNAT family N-acetyltransferase [Gordonia soli]GAC68489.1 putative acetyltransferase [Gordonia soli NBRC 108243]
MISYEWCPQLVDEDLDEVLALVAASAEYDDEAGFTRVDPDLVRERDGVDGAIRHLAIKARRDLGPDEDGPKVVVAYLHLAVDENRIGTVSYVVHPDFRSRGITTLLVEQIGLDIDERAGWVGSGADALRCWAYATHPASERLTKRFRVPAVSRQWTLVRPLAGPYALPVERPGTPTGASISESRPIRADDDDVVALLGRARLPEVQRDRLGVDMRRGTGQVAFARNDDDQVIGFVWYSTETHVHSELRTASVDALIVAADDRGCGLGGALLAEALERQRDAGVQLSMLRIDPDDVAAVRMCRLLGFEQEDAHACYQVGQTTAPPPAFE